MAFSNFKNIQQVLERYPLAYIKENFLPDVRLDLPDWFVDNLKFAGLREAEGENEAFFRESFIFPFLQLAWKRHARLKLWIHHALEYDDVLFGEPDYFVACWPEGVTNTLVLPPLMAVAEAKRQDFDEGWGQCLAAMIAAQKLNPDDAIVVYGIVSTGLVWEFGKLAGTRFIRDPFAYAIADPPKVFGLLDFVLTECEQQIKN